MLSLPPTPMMLRTVVASALPLFVAPTPQQAGPARELSSAEKELVARLAEQQVQLDPVRGFCAFPADVDIRDDLLEYLLVGPAGAAHESGFQTPVAPSALNVALLALGVEPGSNADWRPKDPLPSEAELRAGANPYEISVPAGDGFYLYVGWKQAGETYFFRVEDLIRNLGTGQAMTRHRWVYLGSRMVRGGKKDASEVFAAEIYQNLINVAFFRDGYTLVTSALPECIDQSVWMLNAWLVPERGSRLEMVMSRSRIDALPPEIDKLLPSITPDSSAPENER